MQCNVMNVCIHNFIYRIHICILAYTFYIRYGRVGGVTFDDAMLACVASEIFLRKCWLFELLQ
jgi:hypothetical protein